MRVQQNVSLQASEDRLDVSIELSVDGSNGDKIVGSIEKALAGARTAVVAALEAKRS